MEQANKTEGVDEGVTRRRMLQAGGGLGLLAFLLGIRECGKGAGPAIDGEQPFDVWEELRVALRTSPDHLPARAEELIAQGDGAGLFALVRDQVITVPARVNSVGGEDELRFGTRACLRCGAGTPREKAELLAELMRRAGYRATVRGIRRSIRDGDTRAVLLRPVDRPFAPTISPEQIARWGKALGVDPGRVDDADFVGAHFVDGDGSEAKELADRLLALLKADGDEPSTKFDWRWTAKKPVIEYRRGSESGYCDLFAPQPQDFGTLAEGDEGLLVDLKPVRATESVEVSLTARRSGQAKERIELVAGTWTADQLAGRQLHIRMVPGIDFDQFGVRQPSEVPAFLPIIGLQAIDSTADEMDTESVSGPAITPFGTKIELGAAHPDSGAGGGQETAGTNPAAAARVVRLEVEARAAGFPRVQLAVRAIDADGELVPGLGARDFRVEDEQRPATALLVRGASRPRVIVLHDSSISMPAEYLGAGMESLLAELEETLAAAIPDVELVSRATDSSLWTALSRAAAEGPDLIVMVTDGDEADQLTPQMEGILAAGPRALVLDVASRGNDSFQTMAEITEGWTYPVADSGAAVQLIADALTSIPIFPYLLEYGAVESGPDVRSAHVGLHGSGADRAWAEYSVPSAEGELVSGLTGLYLTVKVGRSSVTRTLAGFDPDLHAGSGEQSWMVQEVRQRFWSAFSLYFEGDGVPASVALDDVLAAKLSLRPAVRAMQQGDRVALRERMQDGLLSVSHAVLNLCAVLPGAVTKDSITWTAGMRVILQRTDVDPIAGERASRVDMLPLADIRTAMVDGVAAFARNVERTAHLALVESAGWEHSTLGQLQGEVWTTKKQAKQAGFPGDAPDAVRRWWRERVDRGADYAVHSTRPELQTAIVIRRASGEVYPILADGSGGGLNQSQLDQLRELNLVVDTYLQVLGIAGVGGLSVGIVAQYAKTLVQLYAFASEAIIIMDASFLDDAIEQAFRELACRVARTIGFGLGGPGGKILSGINYLLTYAAPDGTTNPFSCE